MEAPMSVYRFCVVCREREGDCHCAFLGKTPRWEVRDGETHATIAEAPPSKVRPRLGTADEVFRDRCDRAAFDPACRCIYPEEAERPDFG